MAPLRLILAALIAVPIAETPLLANRWRGATPDGGPFCALETCPDGR